MTSLSTRVLRALVIAAAGMLPGSVSGQDVSMIFMFKAAWYDQTTAGDPVPYPAADDPYDFTVSAYLSDAVLSDPDWGFWISGMVFRTPGGRTEVMDIDYDVGSFDYYGGAVSASALNTRYGAGSYRFTLSSVITGDSVYTVPLAADAYPPAPKLTNFEAAQKVDPTRDFTLQWVPFTGSGSREIWLDVYEDETFVGVYGDGPIDGDATSVVIPAGAFEENKAYLLRLSFTRYTHESAQTETATFSGFEAYNTIPLKTVTGGAAPDPSRITGYRVLGNGDLELTADCTPGLPLTVQAAAALGAPWSNLQTATPAGSPSVLVIPKASLGGQVYLRLYQE